MEGGHNMLYKNFAQEMTRYYADGTEPMCVNQDFRYSLRMHQNRLRAKGIGIRRWFQIDREANTMALNMDSGDHTVTRDLAHFRYVCDYFASGRLLKRIDERRMLSTIELDKKVPSGITYNSEITCPNCGNKGTYMSFASGCPSCGTRFKMDQVYPCVGFYYTFPELVNTNENRKQQNTLGRIVAKAFIITDSIVFALTFLGFFLFGDYFSAGISLGRAIGEALVAAVIAVLAASAIVGAISLIAMIVQGLTFGAKFASNAAKTISEGIELNVAIKRKEEMTAALSSVMPGFSYEYLEGKVVSFLRTIAFTDDRMHLSVYSGKDPLPVLDHAVDIEYRGCLEYLNSSVEDGILNVDLKAYTFVTYFKDGALIRNKETWKMRMARRKDVALDPTFSIHAVNCSSCGGSFDAAYQSVCPHCGRQYDVTEDDWVVKYMVLDQNR